MRKIDIVSTFGHAPGVTRELHAVFFGSRDGRGDRWNRMGAVLDWSARQAMPDWLVSVRRFTQPPTSAESASFVDNTHKLEEWTRIVEASADGTELVLIDADTMVLGPLDAMFSDGSPDVQVTRKYNTQRFIFNGGVVAIRSSEDSRAFMRTWRDRNEEFFRNPAQRAPYLLTFGGINQSALGSLLEEPRWNKLVGMLDCQRWNACYEPLWQRAEATHAAVVHFKSHLRRELFGSRTGKYFSLIAKWEKFEREARSAQPREEQSA